MEKEVLGAVKSAIHEAIVKRLTEYNSPLNKVIDAVIVGHDSQLKSIMTGAIEAAIGDDGFKRQIHEQVRHKLARELVNSFGEGAFKKACDSMKSDPTIRAKCVLAIEAIIAGVSK